MMTQYTLKIDKSLALTDEKFYQLCQDNSELKLERNAQGELIIMAPTGGDTGKKNFEMIGDLVIWNRRTQLGIGFDSSTCFKLPNGAERSPDLAWIERERWEKLTPQEQRKFPPICPDFVVELMSPTDSVKETRVKMEEYRENGARLGWLINPKSHQVEIYRFGEREAEILDYPQSLSGEDVLPGFSLDLSYIWD